jgi:Domain of unknown function (DUF4349)
MPIIGGNPEQNWKRLKTGWLITAGLIAVYVGAIQPLQQHHPRGISQESETGLGAVAASRSSLPRRQPAASDLMVSREQLRATPAFSGVIGGVPGGAPAEAMSAIQLSSLGFSTPASDASDDRQLVRTASMELIVRNPSVSLEKVRQLAENAGGFLVSSQVTGGQDASGSSITIRIPAARFEEVRTEIRKLALRVDNDRMEAQDVTRQYIDQQARLRNLHAEEAQYLSILKQASNVKDTLDVSEKLDAVRGQIEQQQAEFEALSKQVETVAITVEFRAQADAQVFGLNWRPLYHLKIAMRDGLDGVADYVSTMASVLFYLPTVLLWLSTILVSAAIGWRILRWAARLFFALPKPASP